MKSAAAGLVLVLILILQDGTEAEIKRQADRLDGARALDAAARLVDLAEAAPRQVEAALAGKPAAYRELVEAERAVRAKVGAKFGKPERVTLDVTKKPWREVLDEIRPKLAVPLDLEHMNRMPEGDGVTLKLEEATPLEALTAFAKAAGLGLWTNMGKFGLYPGGGSPVMAASGYRNFLTQLLDLRKVRTTDFGEDVGRAAVLRLGFFSDGGAEAVPAPDAGPEVAEAVDDKGRALPAFPRKDNPYEGRDNWRNAEVTGHYREVRVRMADDQAEKIRLLRGHLRVMVPLETSRFGFTRTSLNGQKVSADGYTAEWLGISEEDGTTIVRIRVTGPAGKDLKKLPMAVRMQPKTGPEARLGYFFKEIPAGLELSVEMREEDEEGNLVPPEKVELLLHRTCVERRIPFEFRDLPLK